MFNLRQCALKLARSKLGYLFFLLNTLLFLYVSTPCTNSQVERHDAFTRQGWNLHTVIIGGRVLGHYTIAENVFYALNTPAFLLAAPVQLLIYPLRQFLRPYTYSFLQLVAWLPFSIVEWLIAGYYVEKKWSLRARSTETT